MTDEEIAARLAEALPDETAVLVGRGWVARILLPVMKEYGNQRAADELEAAAEELDDLYEAGGAFGADNLTASARLDARAAALRGEAR